MTSATAVEPRGHCLGHSRGGITTKVHIVCCAAGVPLAVGVTKGQASEVRAASGILAGIRIAGARGRAVSKPKRLIADRGYDSKGFRAALRARGIRPVIPERRLAEGKRRRRRGRPSVVTKAAYRPRAIVEQVIGWLKECRRVSTRYEKLAVNYLAMVDLAILRRLLRMWLSNTA